MEGRWTIHPGTTDYDMDFVTSGPELTAPIPVVPCDDAAIERAAAMLLDGFADLGLEGKPSLAQHVAAEVLRAAGETP